MRSKSPHQSLGRVKWTLAAAAAAAAIAIGCAAPEQKPAPSPALPPPADAPFGVIAQAYLDDIYQRLPTQATYLGIHKYDDRLEDYSRDAVIKAVAAAHEFRRRLAALDQNALSPANQLDREALLHAIDSRLLTLEVVRPWAKDPDTYSSGLTNTAYIMIKRNFAPAEQRLRELIAREKAMPAALMEARRNLENPPRIYTEIALEQIDGNRGFFEKAVAAAFPQVNDAGLLSDFKAANDAVIGALNDYKTWLQTDLLERSHGDYAIGEDTYKKKLAADEMIELPLDRLLAMAQQDLVKNQTSFAETARAIDPKRTPIQVLESVEAEHPPATELLTYTQGELDALGRFMTEKHIVTIPKAAPAKV
ncbi:MAG: DUF885 family protein, partial [Planctomycetia bacterium]|nr:DUF885 family protein [Planctomycetia bacterium]